MACSLVSLLERLTMQSRKGSLIEAGINVLIGYWINFIANLTILPMFGFNITLSQNLLIGLIFTVISVARSYIVRRYFNALIHKAAYGK
jgi:hypothetical protein